MKIVVDVNLSPEWIVTLGGAGHEAVHWSQVGRADADDEEIVRWAERENAIILTRDLDFGAYIVLAGQTRPSVVQVRGKRSLIEKNAALVVHAIQDTASALEEGALVTIDFTKVRVRQLAYPDSY